MDIKNEFPIIKFVCADCTDNSFSISLYVKKSMEIIEKYNAIFCFDTENKTFSEEEIASIKQEQKEKYGKRGTSLFIKFKNILYFEDAYFIYKTLLPIKIMVDESEILKQFYSFFFDFLRNKLEQLKHIPVIFFGHKVKNCRLLEQLDSKESGNLLPSFSSDQTEPPVNFLSYFKNKRSLYLSNSRDLISLENDMIYYQYLHFYLKSKYGIIFQLEKPADFLYINNYVNSYLENLQRLLDNAKKDQRNLEILINELM